MKSIVSAINLVIIYFQKLYDNCYRFIFGIPTLRRSQITANLYLGGQYNLSGLHKLKAMGITAIVNMRITSIYTEVDYSGFKYLHLPTPDQTPPKLEDLIKGAEFVETEIKNGGKVYIHCKHGQGRGPSMAISYLMKIGTSFEDAFKLVRKVRTFIEPTPDQISRLKELEKYYKTKPETSEVKIQSM